MKKLKLTFISFFMAFTAQAFAADHSHLDPDKVVPKSLLKKALDYFDSHKDKIRRKESLQS